MALLPTNFYIKEGQVNKPVTVLNTYFEDDDANIHFFYNGKQSVIGLHHPDYVFKNDEQHKYAMVAYIEFNDIGDPEEPVQIEEKFEVSLLYDNRQIMNSIIIDFMGLAYNGELIDSKCSVTDNKVKQGTNTQATIYPDPVVKVTTEDRDPESDEDKGSKGIGIWINIEGVEYMLTHVLKSLSANSLPIDVEHAPSYYTIEFLTNYTKETDINVLNLEDHITDNLITEATKSDQYQNDVFENISAIIKGQPHQFIQNTVVYDPVYTPSTAKTEDVVKGTSVIGPTTDRIVSLDSVNKTFRVIQGGVYSLQLKNGFYLVQGESRVDLNVYVGTNQIKEMRICAYLTSNPEGQDDEGKVIKNIFSSNTYTAYIPANTEIKLTANFMNTDNIVLENETMLTITQMQTNCPDYE